MARTITERMADAAYHDFCAPYSLMCDAWDMIADRSNGATPVATRGVFQVALMLALDRFEADPNGYEFNRAADGSPAEAVEPAHVVSGAWPKR